MKSFLMSTAFLQGIGTTEILIIFFVVLLLFGAKKLPELARGLGKSIKEFKKATTEMEDDLRTALDANEAEKPTQDPKTVSTDEEKKNDRPAKEKPNP